MEIRVMADPKEIAEIEKGSRIKAAREAANLTQEELGRLCGTTKQTIYKYESGIIKNIPIDRLTDIANALGLSVFELLIDRVPPKYKGGGDLMEKKDLYASVEEARMTLCDVIKRFGEKAATAEEVEALAAVACALSKLLRAD